MQEVQVQAGGPKRKPEVSADQRGSNGGQVTITHSGEDRTGSQPIHHSRQKRQWTQGVNSHSSGSAIGNKNSANSLGAEHPQARVRAAPQMQRRRKCDYCKRKQDIEESFSIEARLVFACPPFARLKQTDLFCLYCVAHLQSLYRNWFPR